MEFLYIQVNFYFYKYMYFCKMFFYKLTNYILGLLPDARKIE